MDNLDNQMTAENLEALRASLAELEGPARAAIAEEIKTARGFGDLKENAEYHEAKNAQARLETKIIQLRHRLMDARGGRGGRRRRRGLRARPSRSRTRPAASG